MKSIFQVHHTAVSVLLVLAWILAPIQLNETFFVIVFTAIVMMITILIINLIINNNETNKSEG
jgi:hypothetical protein